MKRRIGRITLSMIMSALMVLTMPLTALAGEWDIAEGDIAVNRTSETEQNVSQGSRSENDTNPTITGSSTEHTVTITAATGTTATVTLDDVHIESSSNNAPISTHGGGNVTIELDGESTVTSTHDKNAAIQKGNSENLTIKDSDESTHASINATGGDFAAGIGGGKKEDASNITITGNANVNVESNGWGAGIGGGEDAYGSDITITGNANVTAYGYHSAGIGGGFGGDGSHITISGSAYVTAYGYSGAGIGGGFRGDGSHITISENSNVTASSESGAGIGGGEDAYGSDITISGSANVIASSSEGGAGIGGGYLRYGSNISICDNATVHVAGGIYQGHYGAGIGYGAGSSSNGAENVDTSNLTTGSITRYDPGTTVDQIKDYIEQSQSQSGQQSQAGSQLNPPIVPPVVNITEDNETAPPEIPSSHGGSSHSSDNNGGSVNTATPTNEYAIFVTALNNQIEGYLKQLSEAIKSGNTEKANAMIKEGLKLNLGNYVGLNRRTITLLEEVSKAGIATTIDFIHKNINYRTSIPANAEIAPTSLLNKDGYCGALNLMKEYGRIEE